jgi:hypothetical protein
MKTLAKSVFYLNLFIFKILKILTYLFPTLTINSSHFLLIYLDLLECLTLFSSSSPSLQSSTLLRDTCLVRSKSTTLTLFCSLSWLSHLHHTFQAWIHPYTLYILMLTSVLVGHHLKFLGNLMRFFVKPFSFYSSWALLSCRNLILW